MNAARRAAFDIRKRRRRQAPARIGDDQRDGAGKAAELALAPSPPAAGRAALGGGPERRADQSRF